MSLKNDIIFFRRIILRWFNKNGREFPWRKDSITDYELIISEILLQRTKAETVAMYYQTFFDKYPDWNSIKNTSVNDLEIILKPLGLYKQRAKRLSRLIQEYEDRNNKLPKTSKALKDSVLSPMYISAAYRLIILKEKAALLDVNMARVLNRFFLLKELKDLRDDEEIQQLATRVVRCEKCKEINWAILDFGALVCTASKPKCALCPFIDRCKYYMEQHDKDSLPI